MPFAVDSRLFETLLHGLERAAKDALNARTDWRHGEIDESKAGLWLVSNELRRLLAAIDERTA